MRFSLYKRKYGSTRNMRNGILVNHFPLQKPLKKTLKTSKLINLHFEFSQVKVRAKKMFVFDQNCPKLFETKKTCAIECSTTLARRNLPLTHVYVKKWAYLEE